MPDNQNQKSGNNSVNFQAENINITSGVSYSEAKEIALQVFKDNALLLQHEAKQTAAERAQQVTEDFLTNLLADNQAGLDTLKDPDMQYSLFEAQKSFARSGDKNLENLLVDLLIDRTKMNNDQLKKVILNDAIETAHKLTPTQLNSLSVCFILRDLRYTNINNFQIALQNYVTLLSPFIDSFNINQSDFRHIEYTKCASMRTFGASLHNIIIQQYPGFLAKGFSESDLAAINLSSTDREKLISPCLRDSSRLQINPLVNVNMQDATEKTLFDIQSRHMINENELKSEMVAFNQVFKKLYDVWETGFIGQMQLTSVGIALAIANIRKATGQSLDLGIWIK